MQKLTILDYVYFAGAILICILTGATDTVRWTTMLMICTSVWGVWHMLDMLWVIKRGVPTTAVFVEYVTKFLKETEYDPERLRFAPVMRYETEECAYESAYPIYWQKPSMEKGKEYSVCYVPSKPEIFYFPDRKFELISSYLTTVILGVIGILLSLFFHPYIFISLAITFIMFYVLPEFR